VATYGNLNNQRYGNLIDQLLLVNYLQPYLLFDLSQLAWLYPYLGLGSYLLQHQLQGCCLLLLLDY